MATMASSFRLQRAPQCLRCLRSFVEPERNGFLDLFRTQTRGMKSKRKQRTVQVKLLRDIPGYGPKGVVMAVAPGRMRNLWFPRNLAQYMTAAEAKVGEGMIFERDPTFGLRKGLTAGEEMGAPVHVKVELLSPQRSYELLESIVPDSLTFYRAPISSTEPMKAEANEASKMKEPSSQMIPVPAISGAIYGSVSTTDILTRIKELAAETDGKEGFEGAARLVVGPEEIKIHGMEENRMGVESDRVKVLGDFAYDIQVRGGNPISRKLKVEILQT